MYFVMENGILVLFVCIRSDSISDMVQYGFCRFRIQVQVEGEGKVLVKVLVGWGKGFCSFNQIVFLGIRKSWWLFYFFLGEDGLVVV